MKNSPVVLLTLSAALMLAAPVLARDGAQSSAKSAAARSANSAKHPAKPATNKAAASKSKTAKSATAKTAAGKPAAKSAAAKPAPILAADKPAAAKGANDKPNAGAKPASAGGPGAAARGAAAQPAPLDPAEAIRRADDFFNSSPTLAADFVQIGVDGRRAEGKLSVERPGSLRFEYASPATLEIVADGMAVAVRDHKLNTQDVYWLSQTPLKFLLKDKIDIAKDFKVLDVVTDDSGTTISIEDSATFAGTSRIKLIFDSKNFTLKQWQVTDPQGNQTLVSLFNIDRSRKPDPASFKIGQERAPN